MYKVAVIQNDSEMMRYSWADIRPMIHKLGYSYDGYTANDITELYSKIDKYDAIIIATNACNDSKIKESLESHSIEIISFLNKGKALAVLFQMKKDKGEFFNYLPPDFQVETIRREEELKSGDILFNENNKHQPVVSFPHKISISKVKEHSLNNKHVKGLYWTYLKPNNPENYNIILEDSSNKDGNRPLILSTREDLPFRIIISAIALDWQGHEELWENIIKYVVEGNTNVALISKEESANYDFRYLTSWLKINKIPFKLYKNNMVQLKEIDFTIHSIYLIDPHFTKKEITNFIREASPFIDSGKAEVIFFNEKELNKPYIAAISNIRQFQLISKNAILWIKDQFPNDHGYFARSFWNTVDVITTLYEFNEPTEQWKESILKEIEKHDRGGCYDEVLGATCAMFEIYNFYLGSEHEKTLSALQWIIENYKEKVLFERASAIDVLTRFNCNIEEEEINNFKNEVIESLTVINGEAKNNEFKLFRYCQTLMTCGFVNDAQNISLMFKEIQDKQDGKWVNISHTAAIVELLIKIQNSIPSHNPEIDEMIFKGVEYLYDTYNPEQFSWHNEILATAKSLKTLKLFESNILLPVDVLKNRIFEESKRRSTLSAIELAGKLNLKYINEIVKSREQIKNTIKELNTNLFENRSLKRLLFGFHLLSVFLILISLFSIYLLGSNSLWSKLLSLISITFQSHIGIIISTLCIGLFYVAILVIYQLKLIKLPKFIHLFIERIVPKIGIEYGEEKDSKK